MPTPISNSKRKLLEAYIRGETHRQQRHNILIPRKPGTPIPIAPSQQPIWLHAQIAGDARIYNESMLFTFRRALNGAVLQRSFAELLRRHEVLRTVFAQVDTEVVQVVYDRLFLSIPETDLRAFPAKERESKLHQISEADTLRPFDLGVGPLIRARLFHMGDEDSRLFIATHHLICDGVSYLRVLISEIESIYDALAADKPSPLPEPRYQYADYALWQKDFLESGAARQQIEYWRGQLAGDPPALELPFDHPHTANPSYHGRTEMLWIPSGMASEVHRFCAAERVTPYMLLLAVFKALLFRYSNQTDILVGTAMDARQREEFQNLAGFLLNTVILRTQPGPDLTFREYLTSVRDTVLAAMANRDVPLDKIVQELHPRRNLLTQPLFQVMYSFQPPQEYGAKASLIDLDAAKFDLLLQTDARAEGFLLRFVYRSSLFEAATIQRMAGHFTALLEACIQTPTLSLSELALLRPQEQDELVALGKGPQSEVAFIPVASLIQEQACKFPDAIAIECEDRALTYTELDRWSDKLAWRLRDAGAGPESLIGIRMSRSVEMVAGLLAILKTGAAYLPVDPSLPEQRQQFLLEDGQASLLLADQPFHFRDLPVILCEEGIDRGSFPAERVSPEGLAYVIYTSGSTGLPKGAEITQASFLNLLRSVEREPGFTSRDSMLALATLSFDAAVSEIFLPLITGGRVVLASQKEQRDPVLLAERIQASRCTMMQATPATWRALIESGWKGSTGLKALCAGETLPRELAKGILERSAELWNMYGPTETTVYAAIHRVTSFNRAIPIGRPIANTEIYVVDSRFNLVPMGVAGQVYIGGQGLAKGYRRRLELTRERFLSISKLGKVYDSGDLARWLPDGTLEYLGRADNQVKIRGFRIELEEIEAALEDHPQVRACAVKAWPDKSGNMGLVAYVAASAHIAGELRAHLQKKLPDYMVPGRFVFTDALPLNSNGKVARKNLAPPAAEIELETHFQAPQGEIENKLAGIWKSILERSPIGRHDVFFDLGGHSLLVTRLLRRIDQDFGHKLSMATLFESPTIAQLAVILKSSPARANGPQLVKLPRSKPTLFWVYAGVKCLGLASLLKEMTLVSVTLTPEEEDVLSKPHPNWMENTASRLVRSIRTQQPHGPYFLGGWCISGTIAYEIAAQLQGAGEEVALLVLLDTVNYQHFKTIPQSQLLTSTILYHARRFLRLTMRDKCRYAMDRLRGIRNRFRLQNIAPFERQTIQAAYEYYPKPYTGRIVAVSPLDRPSYTDLRVSWENAPVNALTLFEMGGDHKSVLDQPNVAQLATHLDQIVSSKGKVEDCRATG